MGSLGDLKKHMFFVGKLWKTENIEFFVVPDFERCPNLK